jgi:hypothetical protein
VPTVNKNKCHLHPFFAAINSVLMSRFVAGICSLILISRLTQPALAQSNVSPAPVRVKVSLNTDGSRTVYETDPLRQTAVATTTGKDGKVRGKIHYTLDEAGRFATGDVFGPTGQLRFKATYKYDEAGRLIQETQLKLNGAVSHNLVYAYDSLGKQVGYAVYDGSGKLVSRTAAPEKSPNTKKTR